MTKYQRGELMEGWNDCPIPPSSNGVSSTGTPKSRKRMSRLPVVGSQANSSESSFASTSSRGSMMPPIPAKLPPKVPLASAPSDAQPNQEVDFQQSEAKLRDLVEAAEISEKEKEFFTKRLVDAFPSLAAQHKTFISQIVDGAAAKEPSGALKTQILNYMMVNSGVSMWGVPLKKLVETLK